MPGLRVVEARLNMARRLTVTVEDFPPVSGKRNLNRYLRARAEVRALKTLLRDAHTREEQAFRALSGGDLGRARIITNGFGTGLGVEGTREAGGQ